MKCDCCLELVGDRNNKVVPLSNEQNSELPGPGWPRIVILGSIICAVAVAVFGTLLYIAFDAGQPFDGTRMLIYGSIFLASMFMCAGLCGFACGKGWRRRSHQPQI